MRMDFRGADYDSDNFPGVVYRTEKPCGTTLLFRSGKVVSTGASNIEDIHTAFDAVFDDLRELDIEVAGGLEVTVQKVEASADLGQCLNLNGIAIRLGLENGEYGPEQFPGLVYRFGEPLVAVLLFGTKKAVIVNDTTSEGSSVQLRRLSHN